MPRIPYPDVASLPETMRKMLEGTPLNVVRMGAHASPALFEAQGRLGWAIADPAVLEPKIRETTILRVAHLSNSEYELHHHITLGKAAGLDAHQIAAIAAADYTALGPQLGVVARLTDEVVQNLSPSDATLVLFREQFSDQILINIVLTIGCYMSIARLIAVTGIEADEASLEHLASGIDDTSH